MPMSLCRAEAWADIEASLEPLLRDLRDARLDAGMSMEESIPVFHATDSYRKHRFKI